MPPSHRARDSSVLQEEHSTSIYQPGRLRSRHGVPERFTTLFTTLSHSLQDLFSKKQQTGLAFLAPCTTRQFTISLLPNIPHPQNAAPNLPPHLHSLPSLLHNGNLLSSAPFSRTRSPSRLDPPRLSLSVSAHLHVNNLRQQPEPEPSSRLGRHRQRREEYLFPSHGHYHSHSHCFGCRCCRDRLERLDPLGN